MGRDFDRSARHVEIGDAWIDVSVHESHGVGAEVSEHPVEFGVNVADHIRPTPRTITIEGLVTNHPIDMPLSHAGSATMDRSSLALQAAANPLPRVSPSSIQIEGEPSIGPLGALPGINQGVAILGALGIKLGTRVKLAAEQYHVKLDTKATYSAAVVRFTEPFDRVSAVHDALLQIVETSQLVKVVTGLIIYTSVALTDLTVERSGELGSDVLKFTAVGRVLRVVSSGTVKLPKPDDSRAKAGKSRGKQATTTVDPATLPPAANESMLSKTKTAIFGD